MFQRITNQIRAKHAEFGNSWGVSYLVSKVIGAEVLQPNNNQASELNDEGYGEEEEDEEEEEEEE